VHLRHVQVPQQASVFSDGLRLAIEYVPLGLTYCPVVSRAEDDFGLRISPPGLGCRGLFKYSIFGDPGSPSAVPGELSVDGRITVCALTQHRIAGTQVG
jgi:hypothetical protein